MENRDTYPKELFIGDKFNYSCRIIHNEKEEAHFREIGLDDYSNLPDHSDPLEYVEQEEEVLESE